MLRQDMREFALRFFDVFGGEIADRDAEEVDVSLPPELAEHFGKDSLRLVLDPETLDPDEDLLVFGSRTFDRIIEYVRQHGARTTVELAPRHPPSETPLAQVEVLQGELRDAEQEVSVEPYVLCTFLLTYTSDEREQELHQVVVDSQSAVRPDLDGVYADAAPTERPGDGPLRRKDLLRLTKAAQRAAVFRANQRSEEIEREVLQRVHADVSRLITYYNQRVDELRVRDETQRAQRERELRAELEAKVDEEIMTRQLRVDVDLLSLCIIQAPMERHKGMLVHDPAEAPVGLERNLYTGEVRWPQCAACEQPAQAVAVCRGGHVACPECWSECGQCGLPICKACGCQTCSVCGKPVCTECKATCTACRNWVCADHVTVCARCEKEVCGKCAGACSDCGRVECRGHLAECVVCAQVTCRDCAVRCVGCGGWVCADHARSCAVCGQTVCDQDVQMCSECHTAACPNHAGPCAACGVVICETDGAKCADCGHRICQAHHETCAVCETPVCAACAGHCGTCGNALCPNHTRKCAVCETLNCPEHSATCSACDRDVCADHSVTCVACGRPACADHLRKCDACGATTCHRPRRRPDPCRICVALEAAQPIDEARATELLGDHPSRTRYRRWLCAPLPGGLVLKGERFAGALVVVLDHDGDVLHEHHLGLRG